ncbi:unnamed protein product [Choristocarpus tenellus]
MLGQRMTPESHCNAPNNPFLSIFDGQGILTSGLSAGLTVGKYGETAVRWIARTGGKWGLIVVSTALVTILPLVFEISREQQQIEHENMQINALLAEGKTRQEIAHMGLWSAIDPNVIGEGGAAKG